jgi:hypothetical protein
MGSAEQTLGHGLLDEVVELGLDSTDRGPAFIDGGDLPARVGRRALDHDHLGRRIGSLANPGMRQHGGHGHSDNARTHHHDLAD